MSGAVTSIPSFTRSGRPSASLRSSSPAGSTSMAFRVSSAMPMCPSLEFARSRSADEEVPRGQRQAPSPDPQAPPPQPCWVLVGLFCFASFAYGLVIGIRSDIPQLDPAQPQPRSATARSTTRTASGCSPSCAASRVARRRRLERDRAGDEAGDRRDRGPAASSSTAASTSTASSARSGRTSATRRSSRAARRSRSSSSRTRTSTSSRTISRKLKEAALAWQLEQVWSKDRILTAYLNTIYFGNGAYGIEQAARVYFGHGASKLTLARGGAARRDPRRPEPLQPGDEPEGDARAPARGAPGDARPEGHRLQRVPPGESRRRCRSPRTCTCPGRAGRAQYFVDYVKQQLVDRYGTRKVFGGGLKVKTTIDLNLQEQARHAIAKVLTDAGRAGGGARRARPARREHPGDGRRDELPPEPVQPRGAGRAAAGLVVQAVRARDGARAGDLAVDRLHLEAGVDRPRRQALLRAQLRGIEPRADRPDERDDRTRTTRCTRS